MSRKAGGERRLAARRRCRELLREERVALGAGDDRGDELLGRRVRALGANERGDRLGGERPELERDGGARTDDARRQPLERCAGGHLLGSVRPDDEHRRARDAVREEREQVERRAVRPVEVLEREHDRLLGREALERDEHLLEEPEPRVRPAGGTGRGRAAVRELGNEARELVQLPRQAGERRRAGDRAECVGERQVREPDADELDAPPGEHRRSARARLRGELRDEPRLPDPGAARDEHGAPLAARGGVEERLELRDLRLAPHEARGTAAGGARRRRLRARGGALERRILGQDLLLQSLERGGGLEPELPVERAAEPVVCLERLGLAAGSVQREDQLPVQPLAERMAERERLDAAGHLGGAPGGELGVDPILAAGEAELLQVRPLDLGERLGELGERRPAPQVERVREELGRAVRVAGLERRAPLGPEPGEPGEVERLRLDRDEVAGRLRPERLRGQRLAQLRDVDLHHLRRGPGRLVAPEVVHEPVDRDGPVRVQEEPGEERTRLAAAERDRLAVLDRLEGPQQPELQHEYP